MTGAQAPALLRRLACFTYEGLLLFGVVMVVGLVYGGLTDQRHALHGTHGLQAVLFLALGTYFVWCWTHGGQTLPMKVWRIRLVDRDGQPVTPARALVRYLASWVWFLPALAILGLSGVRSSGGVAATVLGGVLGYAALALLLPQRQWAHDLLCGTRLVACAAPPPQAPAAVV
jgi:uncharacterized RDD family membrane protein YckC